MAHVYEAVQLSTERRVALKVLHPLEEPLQQKHTLQLFEREFITLAQVSHPRIVAAYDFGVDAEYGSFYAMELLDGGDLQQRAPVPYRDACAIAHDVCSALAFLHSRRLLYRDLSPRNIRCTPSGAAKLIDFGALTPFGVAREVVGTPPFVAPEMLQQQPLDERTDLFGLGTTLYFALTGRHAFPARSLAQLWTVWREQPPAPSALAAGIPAAVDQLVMQLIQLDSAQRPANADEVMRRLHAVADLAVDEDLLLRNAYMVAPSLVGREKELRKIDVALTTAKNGRANSALVLGDSGVGRSRLLQECAIRSKIHGFVTLQLSPRAGDSDYALLRHITEGVLQGAAELGDGAAQLQRELLQPTEASAQALSAHERHERIQRAARAWLVAAASRHPLCVIVDDASNADAPSLALIRQVVHDHPDSQFHFMWSLSTRDRAASDLPAAHLLLQQAGATLTLKPFESAELTELLSSIFGEIPNLAQLASYVEETASGNARDSLQLLQHLIDEGVIRHDGTAWVLPLQLSASALPSSMLQALSRRVAKLTPSARALAAAFAAEPNECFSLPECRCLADEAHVAALLPDLAQALENGVVVAVGATYRTAHLGFAEVLRAALSGRELASLHRRLARAFDSRRDGLRVAKHLLAAGDEEQGLDRLIEAATESKRRTDSDMRRYFDEMRALPSDWLTLYQGAVQLCDRLQRPARDKEALLSRLAGFVSMATTAKAVEGFAVLSAHLDQLVEQVGLDLYASLPASLDGGTRIGTALAQAKQRFEHSPPERRVYEPVQAIGPLATTLLSSLGLISVTNDVRDHQSLPSLEPLVPLSPALWVVHKTMVGLGARIEGRAEVAHEIYSEVMERLARPDRGGLQVVEHQSTWLRINLSAGTLEACMGLPRAVERATLVAAEPDYETQGLMLRHLHELWLGDTRSAAATKRAVDHRVAFARTRNNYDGQYLLGQLTALSLLDDLTGLRHLVEPIRRLASIHPNWEPVMHFCLGELERVRGAPQAALSSIEHALTLSGGARKHQLWANVAAAHVRMLVELGRDDEAIERGGAYLREAHESGLGYVAHYIRIPLSQALAGRDPSSATCLADLVVDGFRALGSKGLNMVLALENRARVALLTEGAEAFERHAALSSAENELLSTRLRRALRVDRPVRPGDDGVQAGELASEIRSVFESGTEIASTMHRVVRLLASRASARGGVLYILRGAQLERIASCGEVMHLEGLDEWSRAYVDGQLSAQDAATSVLDRMPDVRPTAYGIPGGMYVPRMLGHEHATSYTYTGLVVLAMPGTADLSWLVPITDQLSRSVLHDPRALAPESGA